MREIKALTNFYGATFERDLEAYNRMLDRANQLKISMGDKYLLAKHVEKKDEYKGD